MSILPNCSCSARGMDTILRAGRRGRVKIGGEMISARFFMLALLAGGAFAQPAPAPSKQPVRATALGLSAERAARIDTLLNRYVEENRIPGAVALVLRDGKPVYERAVGW